MALIVFIDPLMSSVYLKKALIFDHCSYIRDYEQRISMEPK